jgi:MFS family permease
LQTNPTIAVYVARALRDFGDSYIAILLPVYLAVLGLTPFEIGLAATLALLGSALTTLAIGTWGAPYGHRRLLILASALMCLTGALFATSHGLLVIMSVAFLGTINPTSGSVSIFMPLEHAVLTDTVTAQQRTRMFSVYSIIGTAAGAA